MRLVVDASVAVKWLVEEEGSASAERLLEGDHDLHAPRLMVPEIANALWRKAGSRGARRSWVRSPSTKTSRRRRCTSWSTAAVSLPTPASCGRAQKSRDYRKLHLCVDEQTGEVVAGELTSKRARDSSRVASLVGQIDSPISSARADTAYDAGGVYEAIENHSAHRSPRVLIPPRKGAQLASGPASSRQRNRNIAAQARLGKRKWHTESGYSKRSKVETTFHRYKAIVGSAMRARGLAAQRVEARIWCKILNTMTALGMPDSEMIG